ncbi:MAG: type I methionyl aminopeptidase [Defluviitaleaceae bacterium]|nr:type I methionyl aminopeptidase [Defluviitaleaceae bacterium]
MIITKTPREIEMMREAGRIVAHAHQTVQKQIKPGVTTKQLDTVIKQVIVNAGATPSFYGYHNFPANACISVNEEVIHGIPKNRILKNGDIVSIDIGAKYRGYHGDSAWTYPVGKVTDEVNMLLEVTEASLYKGLEQAISGNRVSDISHAIETYVEAHHFSIVREYSGHGVGQSLHEDPHIVNYGPPGKGPRLKAGMTLAIEPMVNLGSRYVKTLSDNWTVTTRDKKYSAHFEHSIAITENGKCEILTQL